MRKGLELSYYFVFARDGGENLPYDTRQERAVFYWRKPSHIAVLAEKRAPVTPPTGRFLLYTPTCSCIRLLQER